MLPRSATLTKAAPPRLLRALGLLVCLGGWQDAIAAVDLTQVKPETGSLYIAEYRVEGAEKLSKLEVEKAVYPFLGPGRTPEDVESARAALEAAYQAEGFQSVSVQVPEQSAAGGVVILKVVEAPVGRLRVKGSTYYDLEKIKRAAPSMAEGSVPNFNDITRDILALNQLSERRITPTLRAGVEPGTVDIDLQVEDRLPLHGSVELNNRHSIFTSELRLNGSVSYANLWQLGHSVGLSFQIAPENTDDEKVFSGYYLARFSGIPWLAVIVQGTKQDSNVSTLGGAAVAGRGEIVGARALITLPAAEGFYHSVSVGFDYKQFQQTVDLGLAQIDSPIRYFPVSAIYTATWIDKGGSTDLGGSVVFNIRGIGSDTQDFDNNRFASNGTFIYFRGDLARTQKLPGGLELYGKLQGQITGDALVNSEQIGGGGLNTVRGYLEAEALGDSAIFGTLEIRSPSLLSKWEKQGNEWRVYGFVEGGELFINEVLPEQKPTVDLASFGVGTRVQVAEHFHASLDGGFPLVDATETQAFDFRLNFRLWAEF